MTIWNYPTRIRFGAGEASQVGAEAVQLGAKRALIVSDAGVEAAGLIGPIQESLSGVGLATQVFAGVSPNPIESDVEAGIGALRNSDSDVIVALGGGSPIDGAKLIATRAATDLPFEELDDAIGGDRHIPQRLLPIIAIPTTAGTGSEVGRSAVITLASTGRKTVIFSPALLPRVAILDPLLTVGLPRGSTAATGYDALTHCLEAYVAKGEHPMADGIALMGLELIARSLPRVIDAPGDIEARGTMLQAAMMGAVAFQKGLGACHSMAHPLSSEYGLHHGLANALCLPAVVQFNASAVGPRYERVAALFGQVGHDLASVLCDLRTALGLPQSLQEVGVQKQDLAKLAKLAVLDACHQLNPLPCDQATFERLFERAFDGHTATAIG